MLIAAAGIVLTAALAWWTAARVEEHAAEVLASRGERLAVSVDDALAEVGERLTAVAGLVEASEEVTEDEFAYFIDNLATIPGMRGNRLPANPDRLRTGGIRGGDGGDPTRFPGFELDDGENRSPVDPGNFHTLV